MNNSTSKLLMTQLTNYSQASEDDIHRDIVTWFRAGVQAEHRGSKPMLCGVADHELSDWGRAMQRASAAGWIWADKENHTRGPGLALAWIKGASVAQILELERKHRP